MSLKNVIVVAESAYPAGGSSQIAIITAEVMCEQGYQVVYFAGKGPIDKRLSGMAVEVCNEESYLDGDSRAKGAVAGLWDRHVERQLSALLSAYDPTETVVHVHGWTHSLSSSIFGAISARGFKVVVTLHDYFLVCPNGGLFNYVSKEICDKVPGSAACYFCNCDKRSRMQKCYRVLRHQIQKRALTKCDVQYAFLSDFTYRLTSRGKFPQAPMYTLPNPVEFPRCEAGQTAASGYLFVGRLSEEKAPQLFCEAVSALGLQGSVIGDGPLLEPLRKEFPAIRFFGRLEREDLAKQYAQHRALVMTSSAYEASPLVCLEALFAAGIPSIVPDTCGAVSYVEDGRNGMLFEGRSLDSLKSALLKMEDDSLYNDLRKYIAVNVKSMRDDRSYQMYGMRLGKMYTSILDARN